MTPSEKNAREKICSKCLSWEAKKNQAWCKACHASYMRSYSKACPRKPRIEYFRKYRTINLDKVRVLARGYAKSMRIKKPMEHQARVAVQRAVKTGKLIKPKNCSKCFSTEKIQGHHFNGYQNQLDVIWLCVVCHREVHRILKENLKYEDSHDEA